MQTTVYACPTRQQGTSGSIFAAQPLMNVSKVFCCSTVNIYYDPAQLQLALDLFLQAGATAGASLTQQQTYQYDVVMLCAQVMSNYGLQLHANAVSAYDHGDLQGCVHGCAYVAATCVMSCCRVLRQLECVSGAD